MKTVIRAFFRTLRLVLGPLVLFNEWLRRPSGVKRDPARQAEVDRQCQDLVLYQFKTCPFCIKVRQEMRRLSLPIGQLDAQHDGVHRSALQAGSGATKVPCLKIMDDTGQARWLGDSAAIIAYLRQRFSA